MLLPDRPSRVPGASTIGRRGFLLGAGAVAAVSLTGCSLFGGSSPTTRTVTATAPPPVDPMLTLIATTRLHLARLDAALTSVAADPAAVALLTPLRSDRAAHLAALIAEQDRSEGVTSSVDASGAAGTVAALPPDTATVIAAIRSDADNAQVQFTDGVGSTGRYRAALFASIVACLATHRSVLV